MSRARQDARAALAKARRTPIPPPPVGYTPPAAASPAREAGAIAVEVTALLRASCDAFMGLVQRKSAADARALLSMFDVMTIDAAALSPTGRAVARAIRRILARHLQRQTGQYTDHGFWRRSYRTTIDAARPQIEQDFPALAGVPVELLALLCYLDERGLR